MNQQLHLQAIPALHDNYIWLVHDGVCALVVDPGQAQPVLDVLAARHLKLTTILVTHHHNDHIGGVAQLRNASGATVYGPAREDIPEPFVKMHEGEAFRALGVDFQVLDVPGHTAGHIAYFSHDLNHRLKQPLLFCGDTLFSAGCGRLFEGTPAQMLQSLHKLMQLPPSTLVCCAHEYTVANLRFAQAVEPDNPEIADYLAHCLVLRQAGAPTLPAVLGTELRINPFLCSEAASIRQAVKARDATVDEKDDVAVFAALRQWKNNF